jgi:hypothetical protein
MQSGRGLQQGRQVLGVFREPRQAFWHRSPGCQIIQASRQGIFETGNVIGHKSG